MVRKMFARVVSVPPGLAGDPAFLPKINQEPNWDFG